MCIANLILKLVFQGGTFKWNGVFTMTTKLLLGITADGLFVNFTNKDWMIYSFDVAFLGPELNSVSLDIVIFFVGCILLNFSANL